MTYEQDKFKLYKTVSMTCLIIGWVMLIFAILTPLNPAKANFAIGSLIFNGVGIGTSVILFRVHSRMQENDREK